MPQQKSTLTAAEWQQLGELTPDELKQLKLGAPAAPPPALERPDPIAGMPGLMRAHTSEPARGAVSPQTARAVEQFAAEPPRPPQRFTEANPPQGTPVGRFIENTADAWGITPTKIGETISGVYNLGKKAVSNPATLPVMAAGLAKEGVIDPAREHGGAFVRNVARAGMGQYGGMEPEGLEAIPMVGREFGQAREQMEQGDMAGGAGRTFGAMTMIPSLVNAPRDVLQMASRGARLLPEAAATASPVTRGASNLIQAGGRAAERGAAALPRVPDIGDAARPVVQIAGDVMRGGVTNPIRNSAVRGTNTALKLGDDRELAEVILRENLLKGGVEAGEARIPVKRAEAETAARQAGGTTPGERLATSADVDVFMRNREKAQVARTREIPGTDYKAGDTKRYREEVAAEVGDPVGRRHPDVGKNLQRIEDLDRAEQAFKRAPETARGDYIPRDTGMVGAVPQVLRATKPGRQQSKYNFANRADKVLQLTPSMLRAAILAELAKGKTP